VANSHSLLQLIERQTFLIPFLKQPSFDTTEKKLQYDSNFHDRIIRASRNPFLLRLRDSYRLFGLLANVGRPLEDVKGDHEQIVEAIRNDDPDKAEMCARKHVEAARIFISKKTDKEKTL